MILVTGGTGLVGSHLLYELAMAGYSIRAIRRKDSQEDLVKKVFLWYDPVGGEALFCKIEWVEADLMDIISLQNAFRNVQAVFHCAAIVSFTQADRQQMMKVNVEGTANLVNLAIKEGVSKFCYCSSVATIGQPESGQPTTESHIWKTSYMHSWYAISKFGAEREVWRGSAEGLPVVMVNPSVIIGPGNTTRSSAQLFQTVKKGIKFYTKGITGFVDVRDVALVLRLLYEKSVKNERFILNSENLSYQQVINYFAEFAGVAPPKYFAGPFLSELAWRLEKLRSLVTGKKPLITKETARNANRMRYYSAEKLKKTLDFSFGSVKQAAQNTAEFYRKYPEFI